MKPGRNDPCHCGSGRKYKKCHEASDRAAAGAPALRLLSGAPEASRRRMLSLPPASELSHAWELEITPVPATFANDPAARPAAILVVAPPFVLACEMVNRPTAEPDELAVLLASHVVDAAEHAGMTPTHVSIRHAVLMDPLTHALAPHGIGVQLVPELPGVDDALRSLLAHVYGGITPLNHLRSAPETWAGWGMPSALVARLFAAAATFHRAAPWKISTDELPIVVTRPGGHAWTTVILGAAGDQEGLAFYHDATDLDAMNARAADDPEVAFDVMHGIIVSLVFHPRDEYPKPMRAEVQGAKWDVAGPRAWPGLLVFNTPGGGMRHSHFEDVIAALEVIPRFVEQCAGIFTGETQDEPEVTWTDPDTGVTCHVALEEPLYDAFPPIPSELSPSGPEGAGATPLASLNEESAARSVNRTLARFRAWLRAPETGLAPSPDAVRQLANNARLLLELVVHTGLKPVTAISEYDLRTFLYDMYPRNVGGTWEDAVEMLRSCGAFFEFLEARESVVCPWARAILEDTETFEIRWASFPGGHFWDAQVQNWQAEFIDDLAVRILLPVSDTHKRGGIEWGPTMGHLEFLLNREAQRLWITWRDESVRSGTTSPVDVLEFALARQRAWALTANPLCGLLTPRAAILRERKRMTQRVGQ